MDPKFRSDCTITSALDILGDKWILVIIKQMLIEEAVTFKDFLACKEAIATNILSTKLKLLEQLGLIRKSKLPHNKKTNLYHLTEEGLSLTPIILELAIWADAHLRELNTDMSHTDMEMIRNDKRAYGAELIKKYRVKRDELAV